MHEKYVAFMDEKESEKVTVVSKKKNDKNAAEIIRHASLGMKPSDEELDVIGCDRNSKRKKPRLSSMSSMSMSDGGMEADAKKMEADTKVADAMHALIMKLADKIV